MGKSPNVQNPALKQRRSSDSRRSESRKPKPQAGARHWVRSSVKPTKRLRFFSLAVQIFELFDLATFGKQRFEKQAAGRLLARVYFRSEKQHRMLRKINTAYDAAITKFKKTRARSEVLFPESYAGQILQDEVKTAERYQFKLQLVRELLDEQQPLRLVTVDEEAIRKRMGRPMDDFSPTRFHPEEIVNSVRLTWQEMANKSKIPKEYWPTIELPPLSAKAQVVWWKFIWSRLNKKKAELLPILRESGKERAEAKTHRLYLKHFYKQFRKHWDALIRLREAGLF
jgi:hypothetical protein